MRACPRWACDARLRDTEDLVGECVQQPARRDQPRAGGADLACISEEAAGDGGGEHVEIMHVVHDKLGRLAEKPVEIVVGVGPGGATDRTTREIAALLNAGGFTPKGNIVTNKPVGGHALALAYTIEHAGDPHLIQVTGHVIVANNVLGRSRLSFREVTPIATLFDEQMVFAVGAKSPITNAQDLVDRLRKDPSSLNFSISTGVGTTNHISALLLAEKVGADPRKLKVVSFNSSTEGVTATIGGHVDVAITPFALNPYVESGDLRYIAAASERRVGGVMADVPTSRELGYDIVVSSSPKIVAPPGLAPDRSPIGTARLLPLPARRNGRTSSRRTI